MENLLAASRYVNRKSMRESLDSLASPVAVSRLLRREHLRRDLCAGRLLRRDICAQ
uniref:Uncharacterized protein n=1 Tax=Meloidogyne incognita TaxID=6306 RepID=A0A914MUG5_MELIC